MEPTQRPIPKLILGNTQTVDDSELPEQVFPQSETLEDWDGEEATQVESEPAPALGYETYHESPEPEGDDNLMDTSIDSQASTIDYWLPDLDEMSEDGQVIAFDGEPIKMKPFDEDQDWEEAKTDPNLSQWAPLVDETAAAL